VERRGSTRSLARSLPDATAAASGPIGS